MKTKLFGQERDDIKAIHFVNGIVRSGDIQTKSNGEKSYVITTAGQTTEFNGEDPSQASVRYTRSRGFYTD